MIYSRYGFLLPLNFSAEQDVLSTCVAILHQFKVPPDMYQVGYTKLFFRAGQVDMKPQMYLNTSYFCLWPVKMLTEDGYCRLEDWKTIDCKHFMQLSPSRRYTEVTGPEFILRN